MTDTELESMASQPAVQPSVPPLNEAAALSTAEQAQSDVRSEAPRKPRGRPQQGRQQQRGAQPQGDRPKGPQRERKVNPALEKLFALYPAMFGAHFLPLKLGVFQDLLALHPEEFKKEDLKIALGLHARSTRYLESVASGAQRHDLNAVAVEPVAPEHVHHAIMEVFRRRQARSSDDLRAVLRQQLMNAIEASGLSREDYVERIHTQDEFSVGMLDDAFAELGARSAKREALLRAFEASGSTREQFADMYGMDLAEVTYALERARLSSKPPTSAI
jgi:ProP effector